VGAKVKVVKAYVGIDRGAHVLRALEDAKIPGLAAYVIRGTNAVNQPSGHELHPLKQTNVSELVKIEVICVDGFSERIVRSMAEAAKTGYTADMAVSVEALQRPQTRNVLVLDFGPGQNT
jgi:nitrogen regulatory protein PII